MANVASLSFIVSGSTGHGLPQGSWWWHGLRTPASICSMDFSMVSGGSIDHWTSTWSSATTQAMDTIIALSSRTGQGHQRCLRWQHGPRTSWLQEAAQVMDIGMAFGGNTGHRHQTQPLAVLGMAHFLVSWHSSLWLSPLGCSHFFISVSYTWITIIKSVKVTSRESDKDKLLWRIRLLRNNLEKQEGAN